MKRFIGILLILSLFVTMLAGCGNKAEQELGVAEDLVVENGTEDTTEEMEQSDEPQKVPAPEEEKNEDSPVKEPEEQEQPTHEPEQEAQPPAKEPDAVTPSAQEELANLYQNGNAGTVIGINGKNGKSSVYNVSKVVEVKGGDTVTFGPASSAQVVQGYAYDTAGKPLELLNAHNLKEVAAFTYGMKIYTYAVPANAAGVKLNVHNSVKKDYVVARNHAFDLKEYQSLTGNPADFIDDSLQDKSGLFVGDSICYGTQDTAVNGGRGWARRIAEESGLKAVNAGVSGASVSDVREGKGGTILTQIQGKKGTDFDYVVLHGGVNDAWDSVEVGSMSEEFDPTFFDTTTFAGGLETLFYNAILLYGEQAAIGYLINFKAPMCTKGRISDMSDYIKVAKEICNKWSISFIFNFQ